MDFKLKNIISKNGLTILFLFLLFFYITFGLFNTYFCPIVTDVCYDVVYSLDSGEHYWRLYIEKCVLSNKHPYAYLLISPFISLLKIFIHDTKLVAIILQSIIECSTLLLIYKILYSLTKRKTTAILWAGVFGFSLTAILFAIFPEMYVWAGFTQILTLSYIIKLYLSETKKLNNMNIIVLSMLMLINYGINEINIVSGIFLVTFLLCKVYGRNIKLIVKAFSKIMLLSLLFAVIGFGLQKYILYFNGYTTVKDLSNIEFDFYLGKIFDVVTGTFIEPFYALKSGNSVLTHLRKDIFGESVHIYRYLKLPEQNPLQYVPALLLILIPISFYGKINKHRGLVNVILLWVILCTIFNYAHNSYECALFALNYFPILIVLIGYLYNQIQFKHKDILVVMFIIFEAVVNVHNLFKMHAFLINDDIIKHFRLSVMYSLVIVFLFSALILPINKILYKSLSNIKDKYYSYMLIHILLIAIFSLSKFI